MVSAGARHSGKVHRLELRMPSVAIIGTRGYPSYYGGFETAVRKLAPHLAQHGWAVTVYGRPGSVTPSDRDVDARVTSRITGGLETKSLSTLSYGLTACIDAARHRPDVALVMNVANGFYLPALKARGIPTLVNVDGIEWERAKWSGPAKRVFHTGARFTARWADGLVFDAKAIGAYWEREFRATGTYIPYGGDIPNLSDVPSKLTHRGYVLVVARFVPENSVPEFFAAVPRIADTCQVVIVGSSGYEGDLDAVARKLASAHANVTWLGHVSDDSLLLSLWQHAGVYFHGHSVGGTNPALVQAMAAGSPILARDTIYNREVLGASGHYVEPEPNAISESVLRLMHDDAALELASRRNSERAAEHYSWQKVCANYEHALRELIRH